MVQGLCRRATSNALASRHQFHRGSCRHHSEIVRSDDPPRRPRIAGWFTWKVRRPVVLMAPPFLRAYLRRFLTLGCERVGGRSSVDALFALFGSPRSSRTKAEKAGGRKAEDRNKDKETRSNVQSRSSYSELHSSHDRSKTPPDDRPRPPLEFSTRSRPGWQPRWCLPCRWLRECTRPPHSRSAGRAARSAQRPSRH